MKPSNAKKRRLAALNQYRTAAGDAAQPQVALRQPAQQQLQQQQQQQPAEASQQATACSAAEPSTSTGIEPGAFPYNPLSSTLAASHTATRLQLPDSSSCHGSVEDMLEALMVPNMPPNTARNMISSRTVDKSVLLDNPTAKLNIMRPSSASKGRRQLLAGKLLPRAKRNELAQLPAAGLDYSAMLALHELWSKYIAEVLAGKQDVERLLQSVDWHGAAMQVTSSKNPLYLGRGGIVAKATANTLVLAGPDGRTCIVPIKGAVFECVVPGVNLPVVLSGSSLGKLQCAVKASGTAG